MGTSLNGAWGGKKCSCSPPTGLDSHLFFCVCKRRSPIPPPFRERGGGREGATFPLQILVATHPHTWAGPMRGRLSRQRRVHQNSSGRQNVTIGTETATQLGQRCNHPNYTFIIVKSCSLPSDEQAHVHPNGQTGHEPKRDTAKNNNMKKSNQGRTEPSSLITNATNSDRDSNPAKRPTRSRLARRHNCSSVANKHNRAIIPPHSSQSPVSRMVISC